MKKTISVLLSFCILFSVLTGINMQVYADESVHYSYNNELSYSLLEDGTVAIHYYWGENAVCSIPDSIEGRSVTRIESYCFSNNKNLQKVVIPNTVKEIGDGAFYQCSSLQSVSLSDNLKSIADQTFVNCTRLESIVIPNGVEYLGEYAFCDCTNLKSITLPDTLKVIERYAFGNTGIETISIPASVKEIGHSVFSECTNLTEINIPYGVETIGTFAFSYCSNLKSISLPDSVVELGDEAFYQCSSLQNVSLSNNIKRIGEQTFDGCIIESIVIPNGVEYLGEFVFVDCTNLKNITLPDTLQVIDTGAFKNTGIESIVIPDNVTEIKNDTFYDCANLKDIQLPNSLKQIDALAFANCINLKSLSIPNSVESFDTSALAGCVNLECFTFPNCLTGVADFMFADNFVHLKTVELHEGITSIGYAAFYDCKSLEDIHIPNSVTFIDEWAFHGCESLKSITIPSGVESISDCAFDSCTNLQTVSISSSLTDIGGWAFDLCDHITDVYYEGSEEEWNQITIQEGNDALLNANIHFNYQGCAHLFVWKTENGLQVKKCDKCGEIKAKLPFTDISSYTIYNDYVAYTSVYNKFIAGTNPPEYTKFSPTASITRAMFVAILYRMAGNPYDNGNNPHSSNPFSDVNPSAYYYNAACWALDEGITNQTTFKPNDNVTREQTARFLFAYAEANDMLGDEEYLNTDISDYPDYDSVHSWAVEPLQWANYNDMITGTSQGYINPQGATQRIHATRILYGFGKACNIGNFE